MIEFASLSSLDTMQKAVVVVVVVFISDKINNYFSYLYVNTVIR